METMILSAITGAVIMYILRPQTQDKDPYQEEWIRKAKAQIAKLTSELTDLKTQTTPTSTPPPRVISIQDTMVERLKQIVRQPTVFLAEFEYASFVHPVRDPRFREHLERNLKGYMTRQYVQDVMKLFDQVMSESYQVCAHLPELRENLHERLMRDYVKTKLPTILIGCFDEAVRHDEQTNHGEDLTRTAFRELCLKFASDSKELETVRSSPAKMFDVNQLGQLLDRAMDDLRLH